MYSKLPEVLQKVIRYVLFLTVITPLVYKKDIFFPYIFAKSVYFRGLIEIALAAALLLLALWLSSRQETGPGNVKKFFRHPITIATSFYLVLFAVSAATAPNAYRALWGEMERGEGLFGMLHFLIFFALITIFFRKEDWRRYFKFSLIIALILGLYALLEFYGIKFPFAPARTSRPGSLIGNAAFLAVHMLFVVIFAGIVRHMERTGKWWCYISYAATAIAVVVIFLTGTRGVILGLGAGVMIWLLTVAIRPPQANISERAAKRLRWLAAGALLLTVLGGTTFYLTRGAALWQKIPGLDRLATTAAFDPNDPSTQTRIITWKVSWEAFKERPWLGWGPENYLYAWEQNYDPAYALYGETWLDRAHNKIFDLLVMQGVLGLLSYALLFAALFWTLLRKEVPGRRIIFAGVVAYVLQNLLLLDQIVSYMTFFALLAFVISTSRESEPAPEVSATRPSAYSGLRGSTSLGSKTHENYSLLTKNSLRYPLAAGAVFCVLGLAYVFYAYNALPFMQSRAMRLSAEKGQAKLAVEAIREATSPYNYAQMNIRGQGIDSIYLNGYFYRADYRKNPAFTEIGEILLRNMQEIGEREPFDARTLIRHAEMLDAMGADNAARYKEAEAPLRKALEISPDRQEVWYQLAVNLAKQGRKQEAIEAAKYAIGLQAGVARAHFHYALVLAMTGEQVAAKEEMDHALSLDPDMSTFLGGDHNTIVLIYRVIGEPMKIIDLAMQSIRGELGGRRFHGDTYKLALHWYKDQRDKEAVLAIVRFLAVDPGFKEEMEVILDLAEKDMWETIWKL